MVEIDIIKLIKRASTAIAEPLNESFIFICSFVVASAL